MGHWFCIWTWWTTSTIFHLVFGKKLLSQMKSFSVSDVSVLDHVPSLAGNVYILSYSPLSTFTPNIWKLRFVALLSESVKAQLALMAVRVEELRSILWFL